MKGIIFSIEEFTVYDGPGIRTTVFFKGCPLRCSWCHNPEGLSVKPQIVKSPNGCLSCGRCAEICKNPGACILCVACIEVCPKNLIRVSGTEWESGELAAHLLKNARLLNMAGGGITFSGGECLLQHAFLCELLESLRGKVHRAIQTSGYAEPEVFKRVISDLELVLFDLKIMDPAAAKKYTGADSSKITANFKALQGSGTPYIVRMPLIPGVTDTAENTEAILSLVCEDRSGLQCLELLPYNKFAGSKYAMTGQKFNPGFDETAEPQIQRQLFDKYSVKYRVL